MNIWLTKSKIDGVLNDFYVGLAYYSDDVEDYVLHGWSISNLGDELKTHPFIKRYDRIFDYSLYPHFSTFDITWTTSTQSTVEGLRIFALNKNFKFGKKNKHFIDYRLPRVTLSAKEDITIGNIILDLIDYV